MSLNASLKFDLKTKKKKLVRAKLGLMQYSFIM